MYLKTPKFPAGPLHFFRLSALLVLLLHLSILSYTFYKI